MPYRGMQGNAERILSALRDGPLLASSLPIKNLPQVVTRVRQEILPAGYVIESRFVKVKGRYGLIFKDIEYRLIKICQALDTFSSRCISDSTY